MNQSDLLAFMEEKSRVGIAEMKRGFQVPGQEIHEAISRLCKYGLIERLGKGYYRVREEDRAEPEPMPPDPPALTWETMFAWAR